MPRASTSRNNNAGASPIARPTTSQDAGGLPQGSAPPSINYVLRCQMDEVSDPHVVRILSVPANYTFAQLNKTLIIAFGFENRHLSQFTISREATGHSSFSANLPAEHAERARARRRERGDGLVPRQPFAHEQEKVLMLELPDQEEWDDDSAPGPCPSLEMDKMTLERFFDRGQYVDMAARLMWEYDFGAGWEIFISLMGKDDRWLRSSTVMYSSAELPAACLGGEGSSVPEDTSSVQWKAIKRGGRINPYKWDIKKVNEALAAAQPFDAEDEDDDDDESFFY